MKVLVACEESQTVTKAFRSEGHEAFSCDIKPCSGGFPEWHIQDDVRKVLSLSWDLIIAHPPCTYLTVTGNRWFSVERYGQKAITRLQLRDEAINFFMLFTELSCQKVAIENPVGIMSSFYRKPDQIIDPFLFGDLFQKRTCLWLKGLPPLFPFNPVVPEERIYFKSGKSMLAWYCSYHADMAVYRSKTFPGIAFAMATQWPLYFL